MAYDNQLQNLSQSAREALIDNLQKQAGGAETPTTLAIGGGTVLTKIVAYATAQSPAQVAANTTAEQTFTVTGLTTADKVFVIKPTAQVGLGIVGARASATDTLAITFSNVTGSPITPTGSESYQVIAIRS